jgi:hypothetical protein
MKPGAVRDRSLRERGGRAHRAAGRGHWRRGARRRLRLRRQRGTDHQGIADAEFPELNKTAEGEYVIVDLTVTNVSAEARTFLASFNTHHGVRGR